MPRLLDTVDSPTDLKKLTPAELEPLAAELRREIIATVTNTGGHLASNLGVYEGSFEEFSFRKIDCCPIEDALLRKRKVHHVAAQR